MIKKEERSIYNLKIITDQIKAMNDGDNKEFIKIQSKNECCTDYCEFINTYIKNKTESLNFINEQISDINNTYSNKSNIIESWVGIANGEANKLKKQLTSKIKEAEIIKSKITYCKCK